MPATENCTPCCSEPVVTNIQGSPGAVGPQGAQGEQGEPGTSPELATESAYGSGSVYALTTTSALANLGSTQPSVTLTDAGRYAIFARARFDLTGATFAAVQTITAKLRCTNNTIADVANTTKAIKTPVVTTLTYTLPGYNIAGVEYTATAGDVIQLWASISVIPSAGSVDVVEADIFAIKLD